jgi:rhodanese-related sulfurtransferase
MNEPRRNTRSIDEILAAARSRLDRVEPEDLEHERAAGALIVDIRPVEQRTRDGALPDAIVIDRNVLEWRLDPACAHHVADVADHDTRVVIVCNEGYQSSLAAALLHDVGLHRATDLIGGYQAWLKFTGEQP